MDVAAGDLDLVARVLASAADASSDRSLSRAALDDLIAESRLPARLYRSVTDGLSEAGIVIGELPPAVAPPAAVEDDGDDSAFDEGGWDAVGYDLFLQRNWHRLLAPEAEVTLGRKVQRGRLAREALSERPDLPFDAVRDLERRVHAGRRAEDDLVKHNLRLVAKLAHRLRGRCGPALEIEDLFQEGVLGLAKAVVKFDPERGFRFSTYATWWVRQSMERAVADKERAIRVPVHMWEQVNRFRAARAKLQSAGVRATDAVLAAELRLSIPKVRDLRGIALSIASLDKPVSGTSANLGQLVPDPFTTDPLDIAVDSTRDVLIRRSLWLLSEKERSILTLRFGLVDGETRTLEQVGQIYGVTRERIRQIEAKALAKLRSHAMSGDLRDFIDGDIDEALMRRGKRGHRLADPKADRSDHTATEVREEKVAG